ncbi:MAG: hypothetical protein ACXAD7_20705, partial [Candidatus Kariarchaeaceae archaeon]
MVLFFVTLSSLLGSALFAAIFLPLLKFGQASVVISMCSAFLYYGCYKPYVTEGNMGGLFVLLGFIAIALYVTTTYGFLPGLIILYSIPYFLISYIFYFYIYEPYRENELKNRGIFRLDGIILSTEKNNKYAYGDIDTVLRVLRENHLLEIKFDLIWIDHINYIVPVSNGNQSVMILDAYVSFGNRDLDQIKTQRNFKMG